MKIVLTVALCFLNIACTSRDEGGNDLVQDLAEWKNRNIQEMIHALGKPIEITERTVGTMPTKDWNHGIVFSVYSKERPENQDVVIKTYSWKKGDYHVRACCHLVDGTWFVMGASRIHKDVRF